MDGPTDKASYKDARIHLKKEKKNVAGSSIKHVRISVSIKIGSRSLNVQGLVFHQKRLSLIDCITPVSQFSSHHYKPVKTFAIAVSFIKFNLKDFFEFPQSTKE